MYHRYLSCPQAASYILKSCQCIFRLLLFYQVPVVYERVSAIANRQSNLAHAVQNAKLQNAFSKHPNPCRSTTLMWTGQPAPP